MLPSFTHKSLAQAVPNLEEIDRAIAELEDLFRKRAVRKGILHKMPPLEVNHAGRKSTARASIRGMGRQAAALPC